MVLRGRVVDGASGQPLAKARVYANAAGVPPVVTGGARRILGALSDGEGRFAIGNVPPGRYRVSAERPGFTAPPSAGWATVTVAANAEPDEIELSLLPGGVIAGRVTAEDGEPAIGASVHALRINWNRAQRALIPAATTQVNDLGEYRLFGLAPGRYYLHVTPTRAVFQRVTGSVVEVLPNSYFPGVLTLAEAMPLKVTPGIQLLGMDFKLRVTPTVSVRGRVMLPGGEAPPRTSLSLVPRGADANIAFINDRPIAVLDSAGNFLFNGVLPGSYSLVLSAQGMPGRYSLRYPLEVGNSDVEGIEATLSLAAPLTGRVHMDGDPAFSGGALRVVLFPRAGTNAVPAVPVRPDLSFEFAGVPIGEYLVEVTGLPDGSYLRGVLFGGQDVTAGFSYGGSASPFTVSLSAKAAQVEGTVQDEQRPAAAFVVLVPEGERRSDPRYYFTTSAGDDGRFRFRSVPPGDYRVFAWEGLESGLWFDRDFLATVESRAPRVTVRELGRENVTVPLLPASY